MSYTDMKNAIIEALERLNYQQMVGIYNLLVGMGSITEKNSEKSERGLVE